MDRDAAPDETLEALRAQVWAAFGAADARGAPGWMREMLLLTLDELTRLAALPTGSPPARAARVRARTALAVWSSWAG